MILFDAAYAPNLTAVKQAGGVAMSVYLTGWYQGTCAQPSALHAAGLGALGNYEQAPDQLLTAGYAGGVSIGQASAAAYIGKGAPANAGLGIVYSVDVNTPSSSFPAVGQAFDGIKAGLAGRFVALAYGEGALIDYLVQTGRVPPVDWLSAAQSWPGWNPADGNVALVQQFGSPVAGTDEDTISNPAIGAYIWWPPGQANPLGGGTVILGTDDVQAVATAVWNKSLDASEGVGPAPAWVWVRDGRVIDGDTYNLTTTVGGAVNQLAAQVTALAAQVTALQTAVQALNGGGVDPVALAQAIAAHVKLAAQ